MIRILLSALIFQSCAGLPFTRIEQQNQYDCVVACLAMHTGKDYDYIRTWFIDRGSSLPRGFTTSTRRSGVNLLQISSFMIEHGIPGRISNDKSMGQEPALVFITPISRGGNHVLYWNGSALIDPWPNSDMIVHISDYRFKFKIVFTGVSM